jgi:M6 family metalloprotease-like protein
VSGGWFTFKKAAVVGWFIPPDDPQTTLNESVKTSFWANATLGEKRAYLIRSVDPNIDFADYDFNEDGTVTFNELAVLWVFVDDPTSVQAKVRWADRVSTQDGVDVHVPVAMVEETDPLPRYTHELAHILYAVGGSLKPDDLYDYSGDGDYEGPRSYSLMAGEMGILPAVPHLDPYAKLQLGWVVATAVTSDGWVSMEDVETNGKIWRFDNPAQPDEEYVLIENRWPGLSYESFREDGKGGLGNVTK